MQQEANSPPNRMKTTSGAGALVFATLALCSAFGEVATGLIYPS